MGSQDSQGECLYVILNLGEGGQGPETPKGKGSDPQEYERVNVR